MKHPAEINSSNVLHKKTVHRRPIQYHKASAIPETSPIT